MGDWLAAMAGLTFAELENVQAVGIDLFLATAVVQVVVSAAISALRLRTSMIASRHGDPAAVATASALHIETIKFEREFNRVNRRLIGFIGLLLVIAVVGLALSTIWQHRVAGIAGTLAVMVFYLVLPIAIITAAMARAWGPFHRIDTAVRAVERTANDDS